MENTKFNKLNEILFMQLNRLNDEKISIEELSNEVVKSEAIAKVASQLIGANRLALDVAKLVADYPINTDVRKSLPEIFKGDE